MSGGLDAYVKNRSIPEVDALFRGGKAEEAPDPSVLRFLIDMLRSATDPQGPPERRRVLTEGVRPEGFDQFNATPEIARIKEEWGR